MESLMKNLKYLFSNRDNVWLKYTECYGKQSITLFSRCITTGSTLSLTGSNCCLCFFICNATLVSISTIASWLMSPKCLYQAAPTPAPCPSSHPEEGVTFSPWWSLEPRHHLQPPFPAPHRLLNCFPSSSLHRLLLCFWTRVLPSLPSAFCA